MLFQKDNNFFSKRMGLTKETDQTQMDNIDDALKLDLWNLIQVYIFPYYFSLDYNFYEQTYNPEHPQIHEFFKSLWINFIKSDINRIKDTNSTILTKIIKEEFDDISYNGKYDFIEFIIKNSRYINKKNFIADCNIILERNNAGYRIIEELITPITNPTEIEEINNTLSVSATKFNGVNIHIKTALTHLSDRSKTRDCYRNSIKESISAVETMCNLINGTKETLGDALNKIDQKISINRALKSGYSSLYGYTNTEDGIRHAILDEKDISFEDARYMLVSCTAFINYLIQKSEKAGIKFS